MEGHALVFPAICEQQILFAVQSKTLTSTRSAEKDTVTRKFTLIACAEFNFLH